VWDFNPVTLEEVHVAIAAEQIIYLMHHADQPNAIRETLALVPKKSEKHLSKSTLGPDEGWEIRALQRWALYQILTSIGTLTALGFTFVVLWLVIVNKTDLQNAFVPVTFLATMPSGTSKPGGIIDTKV
jgi:hypothetical protein